MSLQKLAALGSYEEINGGAHRKAASIVGAPSLVRRIGIWDTGFPEPPADKAGAKPDKAIRRAGPRTKKLTGKLEPELRAKVFDEFRENLKSVIKSDDTGTMHFDKGDFVQVSDPQVQSGTLSIIRFWWYGMRTTIRVEYHAEYITITSIVDLSVKPNSRYRPRPGQPDLQRKMRFAFDQLQNLFAEPRSENSKLYRGIAFRQNRLWKEFEDVVLNAKVDGGRILEGRFGQVFADFRGMISGSSMARPGEAPSAPGEAGTANAADNGLDPPFRSDHPIRRNRPMRHGRPLKGWARDSLKRLWPLVEYDDYLRDYEFTASGFLNGRALYVSALGPPPPKPERTDWPWAPVFYFLHVHTDDEWQIGRLIDRLTTLGTLRLAATMEIGNLFEAGKRVDRLAKEIDRVTGVLQEAIKKAKSTEFTVPATGQRATQPWAESMTEADEEMFRIQTELNEIDDTVSGDIAYRLERSHYYVEQFKKGAEELRERRIEGFQKYQEFVTRRMSEVFGYIDLLRTRMSTINLAISSLGRQYASLKIASVTCSLSGLVSSMTEQNEQIKEQNKNMAQQHKDMEQQESEIRKIQEFGEIALIGVLIPYYVGISVFEHVLHIEGSLEKTLWLILLTSCGAMVLERIYSPKHEESRHRLRPTAKLVWFYLGAVWLFFALGETPWEAWLGLPPWNEWVPPLLRSE